MNLKELYGASCSCTTFNDFLVRNNGHIRIDIGADWCTLSAAPDRTSIAAFAAASSLLDKIAPKRVALALFDGDWQHAIHPNHSSALNALREAACEESLYDQGRFLARARPLKSLPSDHPLGALLELWRDRGASMTIDEYSRVFDDRLGRRYVVLERETGTSRLVFNRIGEGLHMYDEGWTRRLVGHRVEDQPDIDYAQWVANYWRNAYLTDQPTLSDADVIVTNPRERTRRRIQYSRLTLPISNNNGKQLLLSASLVDPDINLRVEVG